MAQIHTFTDPFTSFDTGKWTKTGSGSATGSAGALTLASVSGSGVQIITTSGSWALRDASTNCSSIMFRVDSIVGSDFAIGSEVVVLGHD